MSKLHDGLNKQVANLLVFFVKLHHHHWYVEGRHFYALHEKFEEFYDEVNELYDEVAERLLMIGGKPVSSVKESVALSSLEEAGKILDASAMVKSVLDDFKLLKKEFSEVLVVAQEAGDEVSADIIIGALTSFDKHIWMLGALAAS